MPCTIRARQIHILQFSFSPPTSKQSFFNKKASSITITLWTHQLLPYLASPALILHYLLDTFHQLFFLSSHPPHNGSSARGPSLPVAFCTPDPVFCIPSSHLQLHPSLVHYRLALPAPTTVKSPSQPQKRLNPCPWSFLGASSLGSPRLALLPSLSHVPTSSVSRLSASRGLSWAHKIRFPGMGSSPQLLGRQPV